MKIKFKKFVYIIALVAVVAVGVWIADHFSVSKAEASASDNLSGWAWSENIGWISFNATNESAPNDYGVRVAANGAMSGYAWSENIGWIKFNGGSFDKTTGAVAGTIKSCGGTQNGDCTGGDRTDGWDGTIKLSGTATDNSPYGVTVNGCNWGGWAWGSDIVGWIHFNGSGYGVVGTGDACTGGKATPPKPAGSPCNVSSECQSNICQNNVCVSPGGGPCSNDSQCVKGLECQNGTCGGGPICGDGKIEGAEQCDKDNFGIPPATCESLGYAGGKLKCSGSCTFDKSGCTIGSTKGSIMIKRVGDADTAASAPGGTSAGISASSASNPSITTTDNPAIFTDEASGSFRAYVTNVANKIVKIGTCTNPTECFISPSAIVTPASCTGTWCSYSVSVFDGLLTKIVFKYFSPATSTIHEL